MKGTIYGNMLPWSTQVKTGSESPAYAKAFLENLNIFGRFKGTQSSHLNTLRAGDADDAGR